jgi:hypothetical protein
MRLPEFKTALAIRRRQMVMTIGAIGAAMLLVIAALYLSDPHRRLPPGARQRAAADVLKDYRTPGKAVDPADIWITQSEAKLRGLQQSNTDLQRQLSQVQE